MRIIPIARALAELPPACTADACRSGRKDCPTPEACRLSDADSRFQRLSTTAVAVGLVVAIVGTLALAGTRNLPGDRVLAEAAVVCSTGASR